MLQPDCNVESDIGFKALVTDVFGVLDCPRLIRSPISATLIFFGSVHCTCDTICQNVVMLCYNLKFCKSKSFVTNFCHQSVFPRCLKLQVIISFRVTNDSMNCSKRRLCNLNRS